jgi:hypothetical protein
MRTKEKFRGKKWHGGRDVDGRIVLKFILRSVVMTDLNRLRIACTGGNGIP